MHMNLSKLQERVKDGESGVPPSIGLQRDTTEPTATSFCGIYTARKTMIKSKVSYSFS